jgi:hypothetical protein
MVALPGLNITPNFRASFLSVECISLYFPMQRPPGGFRLPENAWHRQTDAITIDSLYDNNE